MASWLVNLPWADDSHPYDLLEFYAGVARVSHLGTAMGYCSRAFDISYDVPPKGESPHSGRANRSAFDINGEAGLLLLGQASCLGTCSFGAKPNMSWSIFMPHLLCCPGWLS